MALTRLEEMNRLLDAGEAAMKDAIPYVRNYVHLRSTANDLDKLEAKVKSFATTAADLAAAVTAAGSPADPDVPTLTEQAK
jgi:hypothetical protein